MKLTAAEYKTFLKCLCTEALRREIHSARPERLPLVQGEIAMRLQALLGTR